MIKFKYSDYRYTATATSALATSRPNTFSVAYMLTAKLSFVNIGPLFVYFTSIILIIRNLL